RDLGLAALGSLPVFARAQSGSQLGNLYPAIQALADASPLELSFLRPEFQDHRRWQQRAREKLFNLLHYRPASAPPEVQVLAKKKREGFIEEHLTFRNAQQLPVPAHFLLPADRRPPFPGIVVLHDHGGFYMWGREKVISTENEHPVLTKFKQQYYSGRSIANELVQRGYAVIAIDMFYWGERRYLLPDDPIVWRERPFTMTAQQIAEFNARSSQNEEFVARSLLTAGVTWPGIMLWDDLRTLDYLASRPEVDRNRIACVGLSVGGYRSFMLAALDSRIKAAVDVGWMTAFASQIKRHVIHSMGLTFVIPGMYRYFDLPDLAALIAPRALMVQMGSLDSLFSSAGIQSAFAKIGQCYQKVGNPDRQSCKFFDVPHEFNERMQAQAWEWLKRWV
ncbi:MAG TPA: alpha/beta hydrolase family protein, partial [Bryobacteraceae bacterium]